MIRKLLLFLSLTTSLALAQGAQRIGQATQNSNGFVKVLSGASVSVCTYPSCLAATVYSDVALTSPLPQPLHADQNGNYTYFVAVGDYWENVSSPGIVATSTYVSLNQVNLATFSSPPPIGNVTPNTGAFTTLTANSLTANTGAFTTITVSGLTATGSVITTAPLFSNLTGIAAQCLHVNTFGQLSGTGVDCGSGGGGGNVTGSSLTNNALLLGSTGSAIKVDNGIVGNGSGSLSFSGPLYANANMIADGFVEATQNTGTYQIGSYMIGGSSLNANFGLHTVNMYYNGANYICPVQNGANGCSAWGSGNSLGSFRVYTFPSTSTTADQLISPATILAATPKFTVDGLTGNGTFQGTVTTPELDIDPNYSLYLSGGNPYLKFDATDAIIYDRPSNSFSVYEFGVPQFTVTPTYSSFASGIIAPAATFTNLTVSSCTGCGTVNLSSPAPIGNTTPNTGAFTGFTTTGNSVANGTFAVHPISGFASGPTGYDQVVLGNLLGSYSFYPYSYWATQRAPVKFVWETNYASTSTPASDNEVGISGAMFVNPTSGSVTSYGKTALDFRTFSTDTNSHNVGSGAASFYGVSMANGAAVGALNAVGQIGDPSHTGYTNSFGQAAEFDVFNWGHDQPISTGAGSSRGISLVCGNGDAAQLGCSVGLSIYDDNTHHFHTGIEILAAPGSMDSALALPNNIPVTMENFASSARLSVLNMGTSNNLVVAGDASITSVEYGPTGSNFLSAAGHAVCVKADGKSFGYCSTAVNASGVCTCN